MYLPAAVAFVMSLGVLLCTATGAHADDYPKRKPGLWQISMTMPSAKIPARETKLCIDAATDAALYKQGLAGAGATCSRLDVHRSGDTVTTDTACTMGDRQMTSHGVIVFSGDTSYHSEIKSHFEPPMMAGRADSTMSQDAKWIGPCPADMQPGDVLMPGGGKINLNAPQGVAK